MGSLCDEIQKLGKGIGNTARYRIMEALMKGSRTVSQLVKSVKLSQPAVSQHLKTLKSCKLVKDQKNGKEVSYSINVKHTVGILKIFVTHLNNRKKKRS